MTLFNWAKGVVRQRKECYFQITILSNLKVQEPMKITLKDHFVFTASILLIFLCALVATIFITQLNFLQSLTLRLNPLFIIFFLILFSLSSAMLLRFIRKIFPFKYGEYDLNHSQFFLWKLHAVHMHLSFPILKIFCPVFLRPLIYKIFGANIGAEVAIAGKILDPFLTSMENNAVIGEDSIITCHAISVSKFYLAPVKIKQGAVVGINSVVMPGVTIEKGAIILPNSVVKMGTTVPANEVWGGIPAKKIKETAR